MVAEPLAPAPFHLLQVTHLTPREQEEILDLASRMKGPPAEWIDDFPGASIACFFDDASSFAQGSIGTAAHRLGLLPLVLRPDSINLRRREPVADFARSLSAYAAAIVMGIRSHAFIEATADAAGVPVINAGSESHQPCQALADLLTLRERFGSLRGLKLAYVGDARHGANSLIEASAIAGIDLRIGCPASYRPSQRVLVEAQQTGADIYVTTDPREAVIDADAVCTSIWLPMSGEYEREQHMLDLVHYRVSPQLMENGASDAVFMHPMPAHRGEEVSQAVIDGPNSLVWEQAANRLPVEQAVLHTAISLSRDPAGREAVA